MAEPFAIDLHTLIRRASASFAFAALALSAALAVAGAPTVPISQVPITVAIPAHPQIMIALGNSQSMDGTLSGAIMTGSGALAASYSPLNASSSPVNFSYAVGAPPAGSGFTPPVSLGTVVCAPAPCSPVTAATPAGTAAVAPYTVSSGGNLVDNSPSRLNVSKASIASILNSYIDSADFGLMTYSTSGINAYTTWVYQMSQAGGFIFTNTPGANEYITNPCYGINILAPLANQVQVDCANMSATRYSSQSITTKAYIVVAASSDDPSINDVLYAGAGYADPVCVVYGPVTPSSPFTGYTLAQYNAGGLTESYPTSHEINTCAATTSPTNAGYVPYAPEVMYEERGFGFYTTSESTSTTVSATVGMTSSGATPTAASVATAIAKFTPYLQPETNSTGTSEIKASATQSPIASLIGSSTNYFWLNNPPSTNGCNPHRYIVLITDGLPTMDLAGRSWPPMGSTAGSAPPNGWGINPTGLPGSPTTFNADGSLGATNDEALQDVITLLTAANGVGVSTYIIGVGAGVDPAANPIAAQTLTAMAIAGGTGSYFAATSPQQVTTDLDLIITAILQATQSTASAAVNSTGLNTNSVVYQSEFTTSDTYQDWTGNMFAYSVNPTTGAVNMTTPLWSAQTQLDQVQPSNRLIATWDPVAGKGTAFEWTTGTSATTGIASSTTLGQALQTFTSDTSGSDVLGYLRGSSALEQPSGVFRQRSHRLGDIVDSSPLYVGSPAAYNLSPSYIAFEQANLNRPPVVYVGANDGMLHAFDAATGNERFAYIPRGGFANLVKLASPYYNVQHQFFVNGSPQASDVQFSDSTWHTVLVGAQAQGGNSVYALDVTNPNGITSEPILASDVLWDFTDSDMGLGFSTPAIALTAAGWMVFVGNGYNSANQKPVLYALNPQTGLQKKLDLCASLVTNVCNMSASNGLSSVIAINTSGQAASNANIVYAGDLQGNLWRIDVSNSNPNSWSVTVLFQAKDSVNGNPQPITTAPVATLNPNYPVALGTLVFFVTGQLLGNPDLSTTQIQTVYGIYDPQTGFTPPLARGTVPTTPTGNYLSTTGFVRQILSVPASNANAIVDTSNPVSYPTNKGWFADLTQQTGQRGVTDPRLENGGELIFTTYQPVFNSTSCTEMGSSILYVLNYSNGGSFASPQFDLNGDGNINSSDLVQVPNPNSPGTMMSVAPVGLSLGTVFASAPTIRSDPLGSVGASADILITESSNVIKNVLLSGTTKHRTAWWEIRQ